jgi:glycerol uptake facilitator-like aquaporin
MLRKILREFFSETVTSIVLVIIVLGTNYFQLTAFEGMLSHNYLFTLYTFIVWFTLRWHREPKASTAAWLGLFLGLAILSRPSELVCSDRCSGDL